MAKRRYSDEDRANALAALAANGGNLNRTARELGIPRQTIQAWANGEHHPEAAENGASKRGLLADKLEEVAWSLVGMIEPAGRKAQTKGAVGPIATAFGITIDKMRLLREQSTSITDGTADAKRNELAGILATLRQRAGVDPAAMPSLNGNGHASHDGMGGNLPPPSDDLGPV